MTDLSLDHDENVNNNEDSEDVEELGHIFCKVQTKKGVSRINLFYQMIMSFVIISMVQTKLVFSVPLLREFGMSLDDAQTLLSKS